jgi:para-aminobenzoate synthetase
MRAPRLLYVDAYDSFSNNVIALLKTTIKARVHAVTIDDTGLLLLARSPRELGEYLAAFDAVVVGPGPGNPTNSKDIGWIDAVWGLPDKLLIPVLGICLGFQSLCHAFGGKVSR